MLSPQTPAGAVCCGLRLVFLAGPVWDVRGQFSGASERAEGRSLPHRLPESGKGAKLQGKFQTVSSSEVATSYPAVA
jgi:hypothetical protein